MRWVGVFFLLGVVAACSHANPAQPDAASVPGASTSVVVPDLADNGGRIVVADLAAVTGSGTGSLRMTGNGGQGEFCYAIRTTVTGPAVSVRLRRAGASAEALSLAVPVNGYVAECRDGIDRTFVRDVLGNPEAYTVEVTFADGTMLAGILHTTKKPYE